jgi:hypothetical protein
MRLFVLAVTLSLANFTVASAQTVMPDSENGRYSFIPVAEGCCGSTPAPAKSRNAAGDAGWACKAVPDERSALETKIARLQGGVLSPSGAKRAASRSSSCRAMPRSTR